MLSGLAFLPLFILLSGTVDALGRCHEHPQLAIAGSSFGLILGCSRSCGRFPQRATCGEAETGAPGTDARGTLAQGFVEDSNVSVVEEMVNMIIGQRAYEANSRVVKAADEMLVAGQQPGAVMTDGHTVPDRRLLLLWPVVAPSRRCAQPAVVSERARRVIRAAVVARVGARDRGGGPRDRSGADGAVSRGPARSGRGLGSKPVRFTLIRDSGDAGRRLRHDDGVADHAWRTGPIGRRHVIAADDLQPVSDRAQGVPMRPAATAAMLDGRACAPADSGTGPSCCRDFVAIRRAIEPGDKVTVVAISGDCRSHGRVSSLPTAARSARRFASSIPIPSVCARPHRARRTGRGDQ